MQNDIDLSNEALLKHRTIAEKATPGPWIEVTLPDDGFDYDKTFITTETRDKISKVEIAKVEGTDPWNKEPDEFNIEQRANSAHIVANSPNVVMAHVDEILRLRAEAERLNKEADYLAGVIAAAYCAQENVTHCEKTEGLPLLKLRDACTACWRRAAREAVEVSDA